MFRWWEVKPEECGQRVMFLAGGKYPAREEGRTERMWEGLEIAVSPDGMVGGGSYRVGSDGESLANGKAQKRVRDEGMMERVWEHTMNVFETIEEGRVFTG